MRVLIYNIWDGGGGRLRDIAGVVGEHAPDAVALIEATSRGNAERLADRLGMELVFGEANLGCHLAWLTRLSVRRAKNHRLPVLAKTLLELEVESDGGPLRLFATHLASRHDPRPPADELPEVLELLAGLGGEPHLLLGDLNALAPGDPVGAPPTGQEKQGDAIDGAPRRAIPILLDTGYVDCYRALNPAAAGYTYPAWAPWLRLDYVFASPLMADRLRSCEVAGGARVALASDHLPVWAEFG